MHKEFARCGVGTDYRLERGTRQDKTRDFKCRFEMLQGHVSRFDLMFTVLIPGDE
jgi:hypothetical protein